jgi:RNA polymerase sigma factor (sigma-70 family)
MFAQTTTHLSLLARVSDPGDTDAWRDFCARYEELIRGFARRRNVFGPDADDVVQDVLISLTKAMPGFQYDPAKGKFRSYLKTIVLRAIFKKSRQEAGTVDLDHLEELTRVAACDENLDGVWEDEWRQHHLRAAMRGLEAEFNDSDRRAFQAYVVDGEDAKAVAERLGMSLDQVYQAKSRILKRLRELIAVQVADEG